MGLNDAIEFFSADVTIRRTSDGEERTYRSNHEKRRKDGSFNDFIWCDGNFACDCNRYDFFERAAGREPSDEESDDAPCGHTAFEIVAIRAADNGELLYSECLARIETGTAETVKQGSVPKG